MKERSRLERQMAARGWTWDQVREAIRDGVRWPAINNETGSTATRHVHPSTRRSVVVDDETGEVIHVGGDGFRY